MTNLALVSRREILFECLRMARLSNWIYGREDQGGWPSESPPLAEQVDATAFIGDDYTDTQGAAIISPNRIYFVFRGTESLLTRAGLRDWKTNVQSLFKTEFCGIKAHRGFVSAAKSILDEVMEVLDSYPDRKEIEVGGHSLGGAVAVGVAVSIIARFRKAKDQRTLKLITLGQPRSSTTRQLNLALRFISYYRVQNGSDIVPRIPKIGLSHAGINVYIPNRETRVIEKDTDRGLMILWNPSRFTKFMDRLPTIFRRLSSHSSMSYICKLLEAAR